MAPRALNEPVTCRHSSLSVTPALVDGGSLSWPSARTGVRRTRSAMRARPPRCRRCRSSELSPSIVGAATTRQQLPGLDAARLAPAIEDAVGLVVQRLGRAAWGPRCSAGGRPAGPRGPSTPFAWKGSKMPSMVAKTKALLPGSSRIWPSPAGGLPVLRGQHAEMDQDVPAPRAGRRRAPRATPSAAAHLGADGDRARRGRQRRWRCADSPRLLMTTVIGASKAWTAAMLRCHSASILGRLDDRRRQDVERRAARMEVEEGVGHRDRAGR